MRLKKGKRVLAIVLAALMVVGIMPTNWAVTDSKAATVTTDIEIPEDGLKAGTTYGDENTISFTVGEDMVQKEGATVNGVEYKYSVQGANNPKDNKGAVPTTGAYFKINAKVTGSVKFIVKKADTKQYHFVEESSLADVNYKGDDGNYVLTITDNEYKFDVEAGKTYYFYLDGSKVQVYGISYSYEKASDFESYDYTVTEDGLKAGQTYGDENIANITVGEDMPGKTCSDEVNGVTYSFFAQGANNPKDNKGAIPTSGSYVKIDAVADGRITFIVKKADTKQYHFVEESSLTDVNYKGDDGNYVLTVTDNEYKFDVEAGKTYYFYLDGSKVSIYGIHMESGTPDLDWSTVAAPVLGEPTADGTKITVPYTAVIGDLGGEKITVDMYKDGELADTQVSAAKGDSGSVTFNMTSSGNYTFKATLSRDGQEDKVSSEVKFDGYVLPLAKPVIDTVTSKGNGAVEVVFSAVPEAESYIVSYSKDGTTYTQGATGTDTTLMVNVPEVDVKYDFKVTAVRGDEQAESDVKSATITAEAQVTWSFITYGNGASASKDKVVSGSANEGSVTIQSESGKIVPASFDGLSFYYTTVPASLNFTLRAKVAVDYWTLSNGQEGLGMMATDKLGGSGWNNSYMAIASKVEYMWDDELADVTTDNTKTKVTQKLGIGSQEKTGVTKDNIGKIEANDTATINENFLSTMYPLEQRYPQATNVLGNESTGKVPADNGNPITEFYLTIQKNNTGYFVTYESVDGSYSVTKKYYDPKALEKIDSENVYAGFFVSRHAQATFSDIKFTTVDPKDDAPAEERPIEKIAVNTSVSSPTATGSAEYTFTFSANCDGSLAIADAKGNVLTDNVEVTANKAVNPLTVTLVKGKNEYKLVFTPSADYVPGDYQVMESYDPVEIPFSVTYKTYGNAGQSIWVAPDANGSGAKSDPMSIYEAVKYVQPGQTIVLKEGTYLLEKTVKVERGISGTEANKIYMVADPDAKTRPVLDFQGMCPGMVLAGDYWYFQGFDVTRSSDGQKGIQVSGNNNVLDLINTYHNGNTGIQISRYLSTDEYDMWPANNLILNCTSYGNADAGYEDADGFAAKLTVGDGNVFDGCISHHNADDGWDLFAKVQSGSIGSVTIKNSIAYANGFLEDGTNAGNGNGFKMGGDSMSGYHVLENSIAYNNKAKGIDSNSCPDIQVKNSISFNNGSNNVAFYTNTASETDFAADGVISYRTENIEKAENISPKGDQATEGSDKYNQIYKDTNYYWTQTGVAGAAIFNDVPATIAEPITGWASVNTKGEQVSADWFESLDTSIEITRGADGKINLNGMLVLTDKAPKGVGARFTAENLTASQEIKVPASIAPQTGDTANIWLYVALMVIAAGLAAGCTVVTIKKKGAAK